MRQLYFRLQPLPTIRRHIGWRLAPILILVFLLHPAGAWAFSSAPYNTAGPTSFRVAQGDAGDHKDPPPGRPQGSPPPSHTTPAPTDLPLSPLWNSPRVDGESSITTQTSRLSMQVNAGFGTRYRYGNWVPIYVTLRNNGPDFSGTLRASNPPGPILQTTFSTIPVSMYQAPVTLAHGAAKQVTLYLPINALSGIPSIGVQLLDRQGHLVQARAASLNQLNVQDVFVGILSDQQSGFGPLQALALPGGASVVVQFLDAQTMPTMASVLNNFNLVVLDDFSTSSLTRGQLAALQMWVSDGGALVEVGGPQWQRTLSPLPRGLLQVRIQGTDILQIGSHLSPLAGFLAGASPEAPAPGAISGSIPVSVATLYTDAQAILSAGNTPLVVQARPGQGSVYYLAFDPGVDPLVSWPGATDLWKGLVVRSLGEQLLAADVEPGPGIVASYALAKLEHLLIPLTTPSPWVLLLCFLGYLAVLGPLRWFVLRRLKRRAWNWRIALSIIVVFSTLNVSIALYQQGTSIISNSFSIIQLNSADSLAHSTSYVGLYVPFVSADSEVQAHFPAGTLIQPFADTARQQDSLTFTSGSDGTQVGIPGSILSALDAFQVEQDISVQGGIVSHLAFNAGALTGSVTNSLPTALNDVYVLMAHSIVRIGSIRAGETRSVRLSLPATASNGGPATCGSLVSSLARSGGRLAVQYNHLFARDVPQVVNEEQRHTSLLAFLMNALQCDSPLWETSGRQATLIGWAQQPLDGVNNVTFNGIHARGTHETLLLDALDVAYSPGVVLLPPAVLPAQLVDAGAVSIRRLSAISYALSAGHMTFEYSLPPLPQAHVRTMTFNVPADGSTSSYLAPGVPPNSSTYIGLYNWKTSSWDTIPLTSSTPFTTQNARAYVSPDGRVLLQCVNHASELAFAAFTKPDLSMVVGG